MDDKQPLRAARRDPGCQFTPAIPPEVAGAGRRQVVKCDPPAPAIPPEFIQPSASPLPAALVTVPVTYLTVGNEAQTAACTTPPHGDPVTVGEGAITDTIALNDIPGITPEQWAFLATLTTALTAAVTTIVADVGVHRTTVSQSLCDPLNLSLEQSKWVYDQVTALRASLTAAALAKATSELACYYVNIEETVTCPLNIAVNETVLAILAVVPDITTERWDFLVAHPAEVISAVAAVLAYGSDRAIVASYIHDSLIPTLTLAQSGSLYDEVIALQTALRGIFNDALTTGDYVNTVTVTVDEEVGGLHPFRADTQDNANALAVAYALSQLNCAWGNDAQTATCATDLGLSGVDEETDPPAFPALPPRASEINVAENAIISTVDKATANAEAAAQAVAGLSCYYVNAYQDFYCHADGSTPPVPVFGLGTDPGVSPEIGAPHAPVTHGEAAAATIASKISQVDADGQAVTAATAQVDCYWWNAAQTATCPTVKIDQSVWTSGDDPHYEPSTSKGVNTVTVAAYTVKSYVSQNDADTQAMNIAVSHLDCVYCNLEILAVCVDAANSSLDQTAGVLANTYCASTAAEAQQLALNVAYIPQRLQTAPGIVDSVVECTYGNDAMTAACSSDVLSGDVSPPAIDVFLFSPAVTPTTNPGYGSAATLSSASSPNPVATDHKARYILMSANTIVVTCTDATTAGYSNITGPPFVSAAKQYANFLAAAELKSFLTCFFTNETKTSSTCPGGTTKVQDGTVTEGIIVSYTSKANANSLAQTLANALVVCVDPAAFPGGDPGGEGGPGSCASTACISYYS